MMFNTSINEIPLGVECAWPVRADLATKHSSPRTHRLTEAWRRIVRALRAPRRHGWAG